MPLPVIADVFRTSWNWNIASGAIIAVNVLHFEAPGDNEQDVFDQLNAQFDGAMFERMSTAAEMTTIDIIKLDGVSGTQHFPVTSTEAHGGVASEAELAPAIIIKESTALRGPSHRGRVFLPFPAEGAVFQGGIDPAEAANMTAAWNTFRAGMTLAGVVPVVASYAHVSATPVAQFLCEDKLGTIRRRQTQVRP